jgi:hypothetical protein
MPYASGETPKVGDYVKNQWEQPGTVARVHAAQDEQERVCIMWKDGGICLLFSPASEYSLVFRKIEKLRDLEWLPRGPTLFHQR